MSLLQGLFFPDRVAHPSVYECKYIQQPVKFTPVNEGAIKILASDSVPMIELNVKKRNSFLLFDDFVWEWSVTTDRDFPLAKGSFLLLDCAITLSIALSGLQWTDTDVEVVMPEHYWLNISGRMKNDTKWCRKNHEVVSEQLQLNVDFGGYQHPSTQTKNIHSKQQNHARESINMQALSTKLLIKRNDSNCVAFNKETGLINGFSLSNGKEILMKEISPNFTRAETDNDRGGVEVVRGFFDFPLLIDLGTVLYNLSRSFSFHWFSAGLSATNPPILECTNFESSIDNSKQFPVHHIESKCTLYSAHPKHAIMTVDIHYQILASSRVDFCTSVCPTKLLRNIPSLPRIGNRFVLHPSLFYVTYFGNGPFETYPDRKSSAQVRLWKTTALDMHVNYIVPGENGNRTDCRWVCFMDGCGSGLMILSDSLFHFSANLHSQEELHCAKHTSDLEVRENGKDSIYGAFDFVSFG